MAGSSRAAGQPHVYSCLPLCSTASSNRQPAAGECSSGSNKWHAAPAACAEQFCARACSSRVASCPRATWVSVLLLGCQPASQPASWPTPFILQLLVHLAAIRLHMQPAVSCLCPAVLGCPAATPANFPGPQHSCISQAMAAVLMMVWLEEVVRQAGVVGHHSESCYQAGKSY